MKTPFFTILFCILGLGLFAQPVLEKTYSESATLSQLKNLGSVYYSMDVINKQCHIYHMDHTLYKSIPLPTPQGYFLTDVQYLSETLFNEDGLLELIYIYSKYVPTESSFYYTYETKLVNENGSVLLTVPGAGFTQVVEVPDVGKKLLVYEYDYSVIPYKTFTHVYSLTGSATKSASDSYSIPLTGDAFPNPASQQVHFPIELPEGTPSGRLELYDMNGRRMLSHPFSGISRQVTLPLQQLEPGTYLYQIYAGHVQTPLKKVVIH